jgi:hypothetical protein
LPTSSLVCLPACLPASRTAFPHPESRDLLGDLVIGAARICSLQHRLHVVQLRFDCHVRQPRLVKVRAERRRGQQAVHVFVQKRHLLRNPGSANAQRCAAQAGCIQNMGTASVSFMKHTLVPLFPVTLAGGKIWGALPIPTVSSPERGSYMWLPKDQMSCSACRTKRILFLSITGQRSTANGQKPVDIHLARFVSAFLSASAFSNTHSWACKLGTKYQSIPVIDINSMHPPPGTGSGRAYDSAHQFPF